METPASADLKRRLLVERVKAMLLRPRETWPEVAAEAHDVVTIYRDYLVYLAGVSALASFVGLSLVGFGGMGFHVRVPWLSGLAYMVVGFVLTLAMVYVAARVADALAPRFNGQKDFASAFRLVAYGATAALLGGVFQILPVLSILGLLAALYSIFLLYTGVPVMLKVPEDKAIPFTAVLVVCVLVLGWLVSLVSAGMTGVGMGGPMHGASAPGRGDVEIRMPGTDIRIDTGRLEEAGRQMEAVARRMEDAQAQGDNRAAGQALGEMVGAMTGASQGGQPYAPERMQRALPDRLLQLERTAIEARTDSAMGMTLSRVSAEYGSDRGRVEVVLQDIGAVPALAMAMGAWAGSTVNRETQDEVENVFQRDGMTFKESYRKDGSRSELTGLLSNGVLVELTGDEMAIDALRQAWRELDIQALAGLKRP
ncbi:MAG: Yip1 family protein [Burkholderiaceae bacterium]